MRPRAGISTSDIHFIISKMVSAIRADATEVPMPTNLPAQTVYQLQSGKVHPTFENKKKFPEKHSFSLHYDKKSTLNPLMKSVFKSVDS